MIHITFIVRVCMLWKGPSFVIARLKRGDCRFFAALPLFAATKRKTRAFNHDKLFENFIAAQRLHNNCFS